MSEFGENAPLTTSGAVYSFGFCTRLEVSTKSILYEFPKSIIFIIGGVRSASIIKFYRHKSKWTNPRVCITDTAPMSYLKMLKANFSSITPYYSINSWTLCLEIYSNTRWIYLSSSNNSYNLTIFGWSAAFKISISGYSKSKYFFLIKFLLTDLIILTIPVCLWTAFLTVPSLFLWIYSPNV